MATVWVVGSLNEDQLLSVATIPAPGETVLSHRTQRNAGGKGANQAVAAARAGTRVAMVGRVGDDDAGRRLRAALEAESIDVDELTTGQQPSGVAIVMVAADGENAIVVAPGANAEVDADQVQAALSRVAEGDVVVAQGEIPVAAVEAAMHAASSAGARAVLNLAPPVDVDLDQLRLDVLIVNEHEARAVHAGLGTASEAAEPDALALALSQRTGAAVVITLGAAGTVLATPDGTIETVPIFPADVVDTTGAGDAFTGAFAASLAGGRRLVEAIRWGAAAGSIAVAAEGAQGGFATPDVITALIEHDQQP